MLNLFQHLIKSRSYETLKQVQGDVLVCGRPIFKNNLEKYEWLTKNEPDDDWIAKFRNGKEYQLFYGAEK